MHEVIFSINDSKLDNDKLVFTVDGALGIPAIDKFRPIDQAVNFLNEKLGELLFGGIYCESISARDIATGHLIGGVGRPIGKAYLRMHKAHPNSASGMHLRLRIRTGNAEDMIAIAQARRVSTRDLSQAIERGQRIRAHIPKLSPLYLLHGITALVQHDWGAALTSIWISVEQIISHLWSNKILIGISARQPKTDIPGRREFLKDYRGWTTSLQLELLFQLSVINEEALACLSIARKARNALVHNARIPTRSDVDSAYRGFLALISSALDPCEYELVKLGLESYLKFITEDPFDVDPLPSTPAKLVEGAEHGWWYPIPHLPGETGGYWALIPVCPGDIARSGTSSTITGEEDGAG